jgi:membrane-bound ClpP family serine protease
MHPGRIVGIIMGLLILASVFGLTFYINGLSGQDQSATLYNTFTSQYNQLSAIQSQGNEQSIALAYIVIIASILLIIAGFVGIFPLGTGVLGVVGMALITIGPSLVDPDQTFSLQGYGIAFYLIWLAAIISLGASFWHRRSSSGRGNVVQQVNVYSAGAQSPPPMAKICPSCGMANAPGAAYCAKCSTRLG